jgi:hypothetical protein
MKSTLYTRTVFPTGLGSLEKLNRRGFLRWSVQDNLQPLSSRRRDKVLRYPVEPGIGRFERMLARGVSRGKQQPNIDHGHQHPKHQRHR